VSVRVTFPNTGPTDGRVPESSTLDLLTARLRTLAADFGGELLGSGATHRVVLRPHPVQT